jgi:hypothetical protein
LRNGDTDLSLSLKMTIWRKHKVIPDIWRPRRLKSSEWQGVNGHSRVN